jgi:hypothetical protein
VRHLGSISPNFFTEQKVAGAMRLAKNLPFNFTENSQSKFGQNLPNAIRQKGMDFCARSSANVDKKDPWCKLEK